MNLIQLIEKTEFADKARCIGEYLQRAGVLSEADLVNIPALAKRPQVCGVSVFSLAVALQKAAADQAMGDPFGGIKGLGAELKTALRNTGIHSIAELLAADRAMLLNLPGIGEKTLDKILKQAVEFGPHQ
ncbi:MAG: hypothetical protein FOGNACKC_00918 [Anaerolineae bacterium]|nr:hypothetical protein [Anaerolineae bacterium]